MKKFIALAVAVVMLTVLTIPAFAALEGQTSGTDVVYINTKAQLYVVTVPSEVQVDGGAGTIEVSDYSVVGALMLKVTPDANGGNVTNENGDVFPNAFAIELNESSDNTFVTFDKVGTATIKAVSTQNTPTEPGEYTGTVTYTVELVEKAA